MCPTEGRRSAIGLVGELLDFQLRQQQVGAHCRRKRYLVGRSVPLDRLAAQQSDLGGGASAAAGSDGERGPPRPERGLQAEI